MVFRHRLPIARPFIVFNFYMGITKTCQSKYFLVALSTSLQKLQRKRFISTTQTACNINHRPDLAGDFTHDLRGI